MNLNDVRLFIRVIEYNSYTQAASKLGVQKSTLSRRIAHLEDELGVRLLQRTTRKLSLTDEGHDLFSRCQPLFDELDNIGDDVSSKQSEPQGRLKITMPPEIGIFLLKEIIADFIQRYPQIKIDVELNTRMVDLVEEGIDLAIRVGELADSSLIGRRLFNSEMKLYASNKYLELFGEPETPDDLIHHKCIGNMLNVSNWVFDNWNNGSPISVNFDIRANHLSFSREMLLRHMGIARMPRYFCQQQIDSGEIKEVLSEYNMPPLQLHVLYPSKRHLSPKVRLLIDHIVEHLDENAWMNSQA